MPAGSAEADRAGPGPRRAAQLVRRARTPRAALAAHHRSLGGAGQRGDAAADVGGAGAATLAAVHLSMARPGGVRRRLSRGGAPGVAGPGLPAPRPRAVAAGRAASPSAAGRATRPACARCPAWASTRPGRSSPSATWAPPAPPSHRATSTSAGWQRAPRWAASRTRCHRGPSTACCARGARTGWRCASTPTRCSTSAPATAAAARSVMAARWRRRVRGRREATSTAPWRRRRRRAARPRTAAASASCVARSSPTCCSRRRRRPHEVGAAVRDLPGVTPDRVRAALAGLVADGLVAGEPASWR